VLSPAQDFRTRKRLGKNLNSGDHFDRSFSPYRNGSENYETKREEQQ
jgi:hypothetical protein